MVDWTAAQWTPIRVGGRTDGQQVDFARVGDVIGIRDGQLGDASPILEFTPVEWAAFLAGARRGEFDL